MKTRKMYQVRVYDGIRAISSNCQKLRAYDRARRLVKRLRASGLDAQAWPVKVAA